MALCDHTQGHNNRTTIRRDPQKLLNTSIFYPVYIYVNVSHRCYGQWNVWWDTIGLQCFFPGAADMLFAIREWRQTEHLSRLSKCRHPQLCRRRDSPWSNNVCSPYIWPALWVWFGSTREYCGFCMIYLPVFVPKTTNNAWQFKSRE